MTLRASFLMLGLLWASCVPANDFPTQARVEYVLGCMDTHGGQSYDTLYPCVCSIDKIAGHYRYDEYVQAEMLSFLRSTPGERGGIFRDAAPSSREQVKTLAQVIDAAEASCFVSVQSAGDAS